MFSNKNKQISGFTIVELLVVIVVIGVLAAITIVSYSGINSKAVVASLQSDLSSSARKLKLYYTEYGSYPQTLNASNCPTAPVVDSKYCLKASSGNTLTYCPLAPYNVFAVSAVATNGTSYVVADNTAPAASGSSPIVFTTGGTISTTSCSRVHTFNTSCTAGSPCNVTAATEGLISININGAGGGSGGSAANADICSISHGTAGASGSGNTSVRLISPDSTWVALPGQGGGGGFDDWFDPHHGAPGIGGGVLLQGGASMNGWIPTTGGGSTGGNGPVNNSGGVGGSGGKVAGMISVSPGDQLSIVVAGGGAGGAGGAGGGACGAYSGLSGSNGFVTISYIN